MKEIVLRKSAHSWCPHGIRHWSFFMEPLFWTALVFKARVAPSLMCSVACTQWIPQIHLWCSTRWPFKGSQASLLFHLLLQALVGLKPMAQCATDVLTARTTTTQLVQFFFLIFLYSELSGENLLCPTDMVSLNVEKIIPEKTVCTYGRNVNINI